MPTTRLLWLGALSLLAIPLLGITNASESANVATPEAIASNNWFRQPALSPDGKTLLFIHNGGIYRAPSSGGDAQALVVNGHWNGHPVWSKDGSKIAYASDQHGSLDIYVISSRGGIPERLTFHSSDDIPADFSPDNSKVLFESSRGLSAQTSAFPARGMRQLYTVSTSGGTPTMVLDTPALEAKFSPDGKALVYVRNKGYENLYRKHDSSSFARNIWRYEIDGKRHQKLTTFVSDERSPVWSSDGKQIYFATEAKADSANLWKMNADGSEPQQLSNHQTHPVRGLSISNDNTLIYSFHGELYRMQPEGAPERLSISITAAQHASNVQTDSITGKAGHYAVSPNGKEIAFIARGDLFVTSVDYATTVRITATPEQERTVSWLPDGRSLVYSSERDGVWGLYQTTLTDELEPYFFTATQFDEKTLLKDSNEAFQPKVSPDGTKVAYLHQRDEIRVLDLERKKSHTVFAAKYNYSYSDGDVQFDWSPDSRWIAATYIPYGMIFYSNIGIAPADGSKEPVDVSLSGYNAGAPTWASGDILLFNSSRFGQRAHGSWGSDTDVMAIFLNQGAFDRHRQNKEELELAKEQEELGSDDKEKDDADEDQPVEPIEIDWDNIDQRTVRLTAHSGNLGAMALVNQGRKLYYLAKFEKGYDLWLNDLNEQSTTLVVKLNAKQAHIELSDDEEALYLWTDGNFAKIALGGDHTKTDIAYQAHQSIETAKERRYLFDHIWRQTNDKFYRTDMHGIDWKLMYQAYSEKLAGISNNRDFAILTSELLGELNASHTGTYYRPQSAPHTKTASLGVIFNPTPQPDGLLIDAILPGSPLTKADSSIKPGATLTHINGIAVSSDSNLAAHLNDKAGKRVRLTIEHKRKRSELIVRPVPLADEAKSRYRRWVDQRRALVDKLSDGKLAYVHIPQMDDSAYREVFGELFGRGFDKEALVVDTRFNRGGWLTDDLVTLLSGKEYSIEEGRGKRFKGDSMKRWTKPSIVVMNEGNYSDGHCFPTGYKANNIGKTVGMPVPGTCTAVWWEPLQSGDLIFGIPQLGVLNSDGEYLENRHLAPDIQVDNDPESASAGEDKQLARAVEELLK